MDNQIKIEMGDWMINAGIVGLYNILENAGDDVQFYEQGIQIEHSMLNNFEEKYFNYFIEKYKESTAWFKIVSYKEIIKNYENNDFKNFNDQSLESLNKYIEMVKDYLNRNNYKKVYPFIKHDKNILGLHKELSKIKLSKKDKIEDKIDDVKDRFKIINEIIDYCGSEDGKKYIAAKGVIYSVINNAWNGICFLNPQTKEHDVYIDYRNYFIEPVLKYIGSEKSKFKYSCFSCDRAIKDLKNDLSFLTMTGFDVSRKSSHVWNFDNDVAVCPICKLIYSCIPAGITYVYDKGIYINDNSNIENAIHINNKIKAEILKESEIKNSRTYRALVNAIYEQFNDKVKYELSDIQIVKYEDNKYKFNILSKKSLKIISESQKNLNGLIKCGFKEVNTYFNIYELIIDRLLNNQNLFTLIHKLLIYKLSTPKDSHFSISQVLKILNINQIFLEGMGYMENQEKDIIKIANASGYYLRKKYKEKRAQDKLSGIAYRLLNALKTNNEGMFMDTILNCYLYANTTVPNVFIDALRNNENLKTIGYAFVSGLIEGKEQNDKNGGDNNEK
ncbi:CRISPR-associated protein Cst1 [Brassicibacter mesophilus]